MVTMLGLQYRLLSNKHLADECLARADVVALYKELSGVLLKVFDGRALGQRVSRDILRDLFPQLLSVLLDRRLSELQQGPQLVRSTNMLTLHIIKHGDPTFVLG